MSVSADMYIVISLMFAVFAAVAAVGTSVVLGAGYERLRAGFEVIRKQTGFFADAIHKLDERTKQLGEETGELRSAVSYMSETVERVDKQTGFFADAIHNLELKVDGKVEIKEQPKQDEPLLPKNLDMLTEHEEINADILETMSFMSSESEEPKMEQAPVEQPQAGLSKLLASYFRGTQTENREVTYH